MGWCGVEVVIRESIGLSNIHVNMPELYLCTTNYSLGGLNMDLWGGETYPGLPPPLK